MLYEFAITPDVFDSTSLESDPASCQNLLYLFKELAFNGLIANLNKEQWEKLVASRAEQLPPALRDKVQAFLNLMHDRHRLARHPKAPSPPATDADWFRLAVHEHERFALYAAVVGPSLRISRSSKTSTPEVIRLPELLGSPVMDARQSSVHIQQCEADFERLLTPVLRYARKVRLIDPHLDCSQPRYKTTMELCMRLMREGPDGFARTMDIHAGLPSKYAGDCVAALDGWEHYLRPYVRSSDSNIEIRFNVFIWEDEPDSERLHDRFIITDQCGISAPGGLDCQRKPRSTDWSLLSQEGIEQHLDEYDAALSPFTRLGSRSIP